MFFLRIWGWGLIYVILIKKKRCIQVDCLLLVNFCSLLVSFCSLLVNFCLLLVTFCLLLVAFCSLLVTFCSSIVARYFCVWYKSKELGGRGSPRFPSVTPVLEGFSSYFLQAVISYWADSHPVKHPRWSSLAKITSGFNTLTIFGKKLQRRYLTGLWL